jgi:hypothetical protein
MRLILKAAAAAAAAIMMTATAASAAVSFDSATGTGFVGKGDVQSALGWNNKALQTAEATGDIRFTYNAVTEQETTWDCYNQNNDHTQERARTTTTTVTGVASHTARERNQITGFNLTGFEEGATSTTSTDGPPLYSCPNPNSSFVLGSTDVGDPTEISGGLFVNGVLLP